MVLTAIWKVELNSRDQLQKDKGKGSRTKTLLAKFTGTESEAPVYEFTTLTCIPGTMKYKGSKVQVLDLPGIIEGAAHGKGRGQEVIAVARNSDAILIVLDAGKDGLNRHRETLEKELSPVGIRLNQRPPNVTLLNKKTGGIKFASTVPLTKLGPDPEKIETQKSCVSTRLATLIGWHGRTSP